jgi:catechol 2,3-dioxygenase-like lactoylglutathione lyase family enzyme
MREKLLALLALAVTLTANPLFSQAPAVASPSAAFRLSKVTYVMLGVADVHASINFYQGKLGLNATMASNDLAFFDAGTISLVVSSEVGKQPGDSEVVFAVDHVQTAYDALRRAGVAFDHEPHAVTESSWAANFRDPDGHVLSVFGPK